MNFSKAAHGPFAGIVSSVPFDSVKMQNTAGFAYIDTLHVGQPIPGPAPFALALMGVAFRRRRRG